MTLHAPMSLRAVAARHARSVLDQCQGNKQAGCALLGISYHTLNGLLRDAARLEPAETADEQVARLTRTLGLSPSVLRAELAIAEARARHGVSAPERTETDDDQQAAARDSV